MSSDTSVSDSLKTTIAPWLSVRRSAQALEFYKLAFNAEVAHYVDGGEKGVVARLVVDGAEFWMSEESPNHRSFSPETIGGGSVRMILTVADPQQLLEQAVAAGADVVSPVVAAHGWLLGRIVDPFGHDWEIGRPLTTDS